MIKQATRLQEPQDLTASWSSSASMWASSRPTSTPWWPTRNRLANASVSRSVLDHSRPSASPASYAGSLTPHISASRMARALLE